MASSAPSPHPDGQEPFRSLMQMVMTPSKSQNGHHAGRPSSAPFPPQFEDIFKCYICFETLSKPVMCPACSKIGCEACVMKWLSQDKNQCPHCRAPLTRSILVPCRFVEELAQQLKGVVITPSAAGGAGPTLECSAHPSVPLLYFCHECKEAICSDCAVIDTKHRDHRVEHLRAVYDTHRQAIESKSDILKSRLAECEGTLKELSEAMTEIKNRKYEAERFLSSYVRATKEAIAQRAREKVMGLIDTKNDLQAETELMKMTLEALGNHLRKAPQIEIIQNSEKIIELLAKHPAALPPSTHFSTRNSPDLALPDLTSTVIPPYETATFTVKLFSEKRDKDAVVFSKPFWASGVAWRLKVYCNGNGNAKGKYLSVFLEMNKGGTSSAAYQYEIELMPLASVSHESSRPPSFLCRNFTSTFVSGECWGYNRFCSFENARPEVSEGDSRTRNEGNSTSGWAGGNAGDNGTESVVPTLASFWNQGTDSLTFRFSVRPTSYQQKAADLERYVKELQAENSKEGTDDIKHSAVSASARPKIPPVVDASSPTSGLREPDDVFEPRDVPPSLPSADSSATIVTSPGDLVTSITRPATSDADGTGLRSAAGRVVHVIDDEVVEAAQVVENEAVTEGRREPASASGGNGEEEGLVVSLEQLSNDMRNFESFVDAMAQEVRMLEDVAGVHYRPNTGGITARRSRSPTSSSSSTSIHIAETELTNATEELYRLAGMQQPTSPVFPESGADSQGAVGPTTPDRLLRQLQEAAVAAGNASADLFSRSLGELAASRRENLDSEGEEDELLYGNPFDGARADIDAIERRLREAQELTMEMRNAREEDGDSESEGERFEDPSIRHRFPVSNKRLRDRAAGLLFYGNLAGPSQYAPANFVFPGAAHTASPLERQRSLASANSFGVARLAGQQAGTKLFVAGSIALGGRA
ncbi:Tripartite motif containing 37 [Phlyctochytrium bullatum]|nr:Tripartite motif containing 37 [Phlyctochytrium bullatum]